jgi:hypothetical protein
MSLTPYISMGDDDNASKFWVLLPDDLRDNRFRDAIQLRPSYPPNMAGEPSRHRKHCRQSPFLDFQDVLFDLDKLESSVSLAGSLW